MNISLTPTKNHTVLDTQRKGCMSIELWANKIIFIKIDDNAEVTITDAKASHDFLKEKFDGITKHRVLTEPGRYTSITKEAREFSTLPKTNEMTLASAVIVKSLAHRILINFIISLTRQQSMKMRMFENKEKAIEWLLSLENK